MVHYVGRLIRLRKVRAFLTKVARRDRSSFYCGRKHYFDLGLVLANPLRQLEPVHVARQVNVTQDGVHTELRIVQRLLRLTCEMGLNHPVATVAEIVRDDASGDDVAVNHEDRLALLVRGFHRRRTVSNRQGSTHHDLRGMPTEDRGEILHEMIPAGGRIQFRGAMPHW